MPAAQLRGVPKDGVLSGRGVQLDQHRPDATTVHGIVLRGIKPEHVTRMGRARPADAGPRPVLVRPVCAVAKHADPKDRELRGWHVRLSDHLTPAQIKQKYITLISECLHRREAGRCPFWHGERLFYQGAIISEHLPRPEALPPAHALNKRHGRRRRGAAHSPRCQTRPDHSVASQAAQAWLEHCRIGLRQRVSDYCPLEAQLAPPCKARCPPPATGVAVRRAGWDSGTWLRASGWALHASHTCIAVPEGLPH